MKAASTMTPESMELKGAAAKKIKEFAGMIADLSAMRATAEAYDLGLEIATRSGILGTYKMQQVPEAVSALENIEELLNSIRAYTDEEGEGETGTSHVTIDEWLQNIALLTDMDNEKSEDRDRVTLMTVHGAKGLEFEHVYVAGLEENLFPSMMSLGTPEGLEEERRLFYVAMTRAQRSAVLSFAESRFKWGEMTFCRPSRFLSEIDPKYLDLQFDLGEGGQNEDPTPQRQVRTRFAERGRNAETQRGEYGRRPGGYGQRPDAYGGETRTYYPPKTQERPTPRPVPAPGGRFRSMGSRPAAETGGAERAAAVPFDGDYAEGMLVEHAKFGVGTVTAVEEWSGDQKITVEFGGAGRKTLLRKFAKLTVLKK